MCGLSLGDVNRFFCCFRYFIYSNHVYVLLSETEFIICCSHVWHPIPVLIYDIRSFFHNLNINPHDKIGDDWLKRNLKINYAVIYIFLNID